MAGTCNTRKSDLPFKLAIEYNFINLPETFWEWGCISDTVHVVSLRRIKGKTNVLIKYDEDEA